MIAHNPNMYYNGNRIIQCNRPFSFCVGSRSMGKSFYFKRHAINNFLKNGEKFIYVRRFKEDLKNVLPSLWDDVAQKFPKNEIITDKGNFYIDGRHFGKAVNVNSFTRMKSAVMSDYSYIMFDEFLPENGRYIGGKDNPYLEVELCLNFYQSVARGYKEVTRPIQWVFISNAISIVNPYFRYFGIDKLIRSTKKDFILREGFAVEIMSSDAVKSAITDTAFGQLISETNYGKYALDNEFYLDNNEFISDMPNTRRTYMYNIKYVDSTYGVIRYDKEGVIYITDKPNLDFGITFALTLDDLSPNHIMLDMIGSKLMQLQKYYRLGCLRFTSQRAKAMFLALV